MAEKTLNTRIINKHDIEENWLKATGFTPKQGEIIVYDIDDNYNYERFKIGDGVQNVNALPFVDDALKTALEAEIGAVSALVGDVAVSEQIDTAIEESKADWNQNDETAVDYIKNRPFYEETVFEPYVLLDNYELLWAEDWYEIAQKVEVSRPINPGDVVEVALSGSDTHEDVTVTAVAESNNEVQVTEYGLAFSTREFEGQLLILGGNYYFPKVTITLPDVIEEKTTIHHLDSKYIKDMYYESEPVEVTLVDNLTSDTEEEWPCCTFVVGDKYKVIWNGTEYDCICDMQEGYRVLGTPDNYPFYIDDDGGDSLYIEPANEDEPWTVSIIHIAPKVKQIDNKYLAMFKKSSDFVFEATELVDDSRFEGLEYRKLVGQHIVYVNDASELVEFVDNGDFSYAQFQSFDFPFTIETWNGGIWFYINLDNGPYVIAIQEYNKNVIKEEYLPHDLATIEDVQMVTEIAESVGVPVCYVDSTDGKTYIGYVNKEIKHGDLIAVIPNMSNVAGFVNLQINGRHYNVKKYGGESTGNSESKLWDGTLYQGIPVLVMLTTEGVYNNSAIIIGLEKPYASSQLYLCNDSADTVIKTFTPLSEQKTPDATMYVCFTNGNSVDGLQFKWPDDPDSSAKPLVDQNNIPISANAIKAGVIYQLVNTGFYDTSRQENQWVLMDVHSIGFNPSKTYTLSASSNKWCATYGKDTFIAIPYDSNIAFYSKDGINWTETNLPKSAEWYSVTYGDGKFVAVARYTRFGAYSEDGVNWTEITLPTYASWYDVAYGDGKFVAIDWKGIVAYSEDGIDWTRSNVPGTGNWANVAYGNGRFVMVSHDSTYPVAAYSEDGVIWQQTTMSVCPPYTSLTYGNGKFVAVGHGLSACSEDGVNWTINNILTNKSWRSSCYCAGKFMAFADECYVYSEDGINWTQATISANDKWEDAFCCSDKLIAFAGNKYAYSYDGITWHRSYKAIVQYDEDITDQVRDLILSDMPTVEIDATLSVEGHAADAKVVGEAIDGLNALVGDTTVSEQINAAIESSKADWSQNDETAANFIKNRTHYDSTVIKEYNFTFDGILEGKECINVDVGADIIKVSDETPSIDDIIGATISMSDCSHIDQYEITEDMISSYPEGYQISILYGKVNVIVVLDDTQGVPKGIWFAYLHPELQIVYPTELSYSIHQSGELKKLDPKYIPWPDADDAFELVAELEMAEPLMAVDNTIYTSPNGEIYTL